MNRPRFPRFHALPRFAALALTFGLVAIEAASAVAPDPRARTPEEVAAAREYFLMARESERLGDREAALSWYALAFRHDAQSRDLCFLYLERLKDAGAVDSAVATARACETLVADTARAPLTLAERKLLGEVALRAEDGDAALRHYREAWKLDEDDGDVLYVLAGLYEEVGDWEGHAEVLRRLLPRLDYPPRLMERLARTYARLDRPEAIVPVLEDAWDKTRSPLFGMTLAAQYEATARNLSLLRVARALAAQAEERVAGKSGDDIDRETQGLLARAYVLADRPDSALVVIARLRAQEPDDPGLRVMQVSLLYERGRYKEAKPLAVALRDDAPDVAAHQLLAGSVLMELRAKPKEIRASLARARELSPLLPDVRARQAYAEYALASRGSEAHRLAAQRADSLLALPPGSRAASASTVETGDTLDEDRRLLLEGLAHARLGQELAPREPGQRPSVHSDSVLARRHRLEALRRYEAILAKNSAHRAALFEAGALSERLGDHARALAHLRRLVARDTLHATGMNYLAYTLIERDTVTAADLAESDTLLTRALALDPENGAFLDSRGWWHFRNAQSGAVGGYDSAVVWLQAAADAVPDDPAVLDHLAQAQAASGQGSAACETRVRLLAVAPSFPGAREGVKACRSTGEAASSKVAR